MSALSLLADEADPNLATLLLAGEAHPGLEPAAVVQPDRRLRQSLSAPDYDGLATFEQILVRGRPSRLETQAYLELAARACRPGGRLLFCVEKKLGADSWQKRLQPLETISRHHCKLMKLDPLSIQGDGHPYRLDKPYAGADFVSCPGLFSWDRLDEGSAALGRWLPEHLPGAGAEFGCGPGLLTRELLSRSPASLVAVDVDERAVKACLQNNPDPRLQCLWLDLRQEKPPGAFDWVVINPPFHEHGREARDLGQHLVVRAIQALHPQGTLWLVANRALPYEALLGQMSGELQWKQFEKGFKVLKWRRSV